MTFIDLTHYRCPLALVKLKMALKQLPDEGELKVSLADAGSRQDVPRYLVKAQWQFAEIQNDAQALVLSIKKGA
ncbi:MULTISPECIES: sulfurtransferase TusA family protein [Shewanella]|uniref:Response regulator SirA n=1 Tax=Shewanella marisflavi TaxID=260364 RepID=A0AAC9U0Z1_9GAMM|nr:MULTISPECIES: sulfurtransferase TusA family protein [Shewanella]ASJ96912.1 response regulator SirA [Shewanella marisflavi]MCL1041005.1 sulfurtransferase TusA family protein [Shewanella marisflavi]QDF75447.1 sulfurtransferase TusA family protein [Shewanella marisflavi]